MDVGRRHMVDASGDARRCEYLRNRVAKRRRHRGKDRLERRDGHQDRQQLDYPGENGVLGERRDGLYFLDETRITVHWSNNLRDRHEQNESLAR